MRDIRSGSSRGGAVAAILVVTLASLARSEQNPGPAGAGSKSDPSDPNRYLNAVREFADNVLKYGRDTYGPKHTPLFVDGLNIHTHEPVKWIAPNGDRWILSNQASQQNLFRTLDGLTRVTGDPKYKQALDKALSFILLSQFPSGAWPQRYPLRNGYTSYYTFNDEVIPGNIELLLEAYEKLGNVKYKEAALRGMDFTMISQLSPPQAGWCSPVALSPPPESLFPPGAPGH